MHYYLLLLKYIFEENISKYILRLFIYIYIYIILINIDNFIILHPFSIHIKKNLRILAGRDGGTLGAVGVLAPSTLSVL